MPKSTQYTCDCCGKDLTTCNSHPEYRLCLAAETIPSHADSHGITMLIMIKPEITEPHYFCGVLCLAKWAGRDHLGLNARIKLTTDALQANTDILEGALNQVNGPTRDQFISRINFNKERINANRG